MQKDFREDQFMLRTNELYEEQWFYTEVAASEIVRKEFETTYGIDEWSFLPNLKDFDIIKQLPQDIMHNLPEGAVQFYCYINCKTKRLPWQN